MKNLLFLSLILLSACGDSTVIVPTEPDEPTQPEEEVPQDQTDDGDLPGLPAPPDPILPEPEPTPDPNQPEPEPEPMPPVVQPAYKVQQAVDEQCSTGAVKGLSIQLIDQMNCLTPGVMKSFGGSASITYGSTVFPFQQGPATDTLIAVVASGGTMRVNSALRTLPQQYLLYQWYVRDLCNANLAAAPGRSNHNGGLAIDINDSATWRTKMRNRSYIDNVSGEPWHFYFSGDGGKDVRNLSVLAFQILWNRNYPNEKIDEDGLYGPQTEGALKRSPAEGFAIPPMCMTTMSLEGYPFDVPVEAIVEQDANGDAVFRVIAPSGIERIEYQIHGEIVGSISRHDDPFFQITLATGDDNDVDLVAYDREGQVRGTSTAMLRPTYIARPLGHGHFSVSPRDIDAYFDPTRVPTTAHLVPGWQEILVSDEALTDFDDMLLKN